ncbi:MAG: hypothetical protein DRN99_07875 [Thermoproteota archaeon]|nr:MAG: hypothetical protein DRN99_07875 [Candidatus Korarchaeota archaeon]
MLRLGSHITSSSRATPLGQAAKSMDNTPHYKGKQNSRNSHQKETYTSFLSGPHRPKSNGKPAATPTQNNVRAKKPTWFISQSCCSPSNEKT